MSCPNISQQCGVALLSMLLVFAVVGTLTGSMLYRNSLEIKRDQTSIRSAQAYEYARGGVALAELWLQRHTQPQRAGLSLFRPPEGDLAVYISDEMGKFNLNNLRDKSGAVNGVQVAVLQRLLVALELDPQLALATADWVDGDISSTGSSNTEDLGYSSRPTDSGIGYRTANRPMGHISELLLVDGFSRQAYNNLKPYISALPVATAVNVNSASPLLLEAVIPGIAARELVASRESMAGGFADMDHFLKHQSSAGVDIPAGLLTTVSHYYLVSSRVVFSDQPSNWQALISRFQSEDRRHLTASLIWKTRILWLQQLPFWALEGRRDYHE